MKNIFLLIILLVLALIASSCTGDTTPQSPLASTPSQIVAGTTPNAISSPSPTLINPSINTATTVTINSPTITTPPAFIITSPVSSPVSPPTSSAATTIPPAVPSSFVKTPSTVTFDFESGSQVPALRQSTPFDYTVEGITAHFSSAYDPGTFSVQNYETSFLKLSQFSGNYLYDNNLLRNNLEITFSQPLTGITFNFATTDSHGPGNVEQPSNLRLTAYAGGNKNTSVGSTTARASFSSDSFPQGVITFNSNGQSFGTVVIEILPQPSGGTNILVDRITVTTSASQ